MERKSRIIKGMQLKFIIAISLFLNFNFLLQFFPIPGPRPRKRKKPFLDLLSASLIAKPAGGEKSNIGISRQACLDSEGSNFDLSRDTDNLI